MNKIITYSTFNKDNISKEHYFQDLLLKLKSYKLLDNKTIEIINANIIILFQKEANRFTCNESSSIKIHIGEKILLSIYYILGLRLLNCPTINDNIELLKNKSLNEIYKEGKILLDNLLVNSKELYSTALSTKIKTDNYSYNDTLCNEGIGLFFQEYDKDFASYYVAGNIDYQLSIDIMNLPGATYINTYLKIIILENQYCNNFPHTSIERLLTSFHKDTCHLLINIFELVFYNSLGSTLLNKPSTNLELTISEVKYLEDFIFSLNDFELDKLINGAIKTNINNLNISDPELIKHLYICNKKLYSNIKTKRKIFIPSKELIVEGVSFIDNPNMDNSKFKEIQEELNKCVSITEKINILNYEINSLYDLIDIFNSSCIYTEEYEQIFQSFDINKISLIYKFITTNNYEYYIFNDFDKNDWKHFFFQFINSLDNNKKNTIISLSKNISFN